MPHGRVTRSSPEPHDEQLVLFEANCSELQQDAQRELSTRLGEPAARRADIHAQSARPGQSTTTAVSGRSVRPPSAEVPVANHAQGSTYLQVKDVAERLRCSTRTVHELTRTCAIPHRRLPGTRRCLFREKELEAWENGLPLEVTELPRGGRLVIPRPAAA